MCGPRLALLKSMQILISLIDHKLPVLRHDLGLVNFEILVRSFITWWCYGFYKHKCLLPCLTARCPSVAGILEAVAKDFFDTDVTMNILDMNEEVERTGKKEHVVFLVVQKAHNGRKRAKSDRSAASPDAQRDQEVLGLLWLQKPHYSWIYYQS